MSHTALSWLEHPESRLVPEEIFGWGTLRFEWIDRSHPERIGVERFIAEIFQRQYNARVHHYLDVLIGVRDPEGQWVAALGFSPLTNKRAFLEQYLDAPVEKLIRSRTTDGLGGSVSRWDVVEFGNLAAIRPGASRAAILQMTQWLYLRRIRWVVFTATRHIQNSFARLNYNPVPIAYANPDRLIGAAADWGSYYDTDPQVMFGDVHAAHSRFFDTL